MERCIDNIIIIIGIIVIFLVIPFLPILHELFKIPLGILATVSGKYGYIWFYIFWFMRPSYIFDTTLDKLKEKRELTSLPLDEVLSNLKSGDIVFNIARNKPIGAYCGMKWGFDSVISHAGIINIEQDEPWVLEAVTSGIRYLPLRESMKLYNADITFIRHLNGHRTPDFEETILHYFESHQNDTHKITRLRGMMEMIKAAIDPTLPFTHNEIMVNHRNADGLFCSELVAEVLIEEDILPDDIGDKYPDANEYIPADFTSFCSKPDHSEYITLHNNLKHDFELGDEIFIEYDQKQLKKDDDSIYQWIDG